MAVCKGQSQFDFRVALTDIMIQKKDKSNLTLKLSTSEASYAPELCRLKSPSVSEARSRRELDSESLSIMPSACSQTLGKTRPGQLSMR